MLRLANSAKQTEHMGSKTCAPNPDTSTNRETLKAGDKPPVANPTLQCLQIDNFQST